MSWFREDSLGWIYRMCIKVMKEGPIPNHVAFIMDGNRRFAKKYKMEKTEGHSRGFKELTDAISWCRLLGIREISVYAFSIDNFKRSPEEVKDLMDLARKSFQRIVNDKHLFAERGIRVRVIGNILMLPDDVRAVINEAMRVTRNNTSSILNIAFSYTGREEITQAVSTVVKGVERGELTVEDISEDLLSNCMYTSPSRHPELLIRTSGEVRLSDFMLWQTSYSCLYFTEKLWPEFGFWNMLLAILHYQRSYKHLAVYQRDDDSTRVPNKTSAFVDSVNTSREIK